MGCTKDETDIPRSHLPRTSAFCLWSKQIVYACKKHAPVNCRGVKIGRLQCTEIQGRKVDVRWVFVYLRRIDSAKVFPFKKKHAPVNCRGVKIGRLQCTEIQGRKVDVRWVFVYLRRIDSAKVFPFKKKHAPVNCRGVKIGRLQCTEIQGRKVRGWRLNNWITIIHYSLLFPPNYSFQIFPWYSLFIF